MVLKINTGPKNIINQIKEDEIKEFIYAMHFGVTTNPKNFFFTRRKKS